MKRFIKSLAGKTILFIVCIASACLLAASIVGIVLYIDNGTIDFYTDSEEEVVDRFIESQLIRPRGFSLIWDTENVHDGWIPYEEEFRITDSKDKVIAESKNFQSDSASIYTVCFRVVRYQMGGIRNIYDCYNEAHSTDGESEYYTVSLMAKPGSPLYKEVRLYSKLLPAAYSLRYAVYLIALVSLLLMIACFVTLMYASGRRPDSDRFYPGPLHRVPFDLLVALCGIAVIGLCYLGDSLTNGILDDMGMVVCIACICVLGANMLLGLCMSAASRSKLHSLTENTIICRSIKLVRKLFVGLWGLMKKLCRFIISMIRGVPFVWKTAVVFCGISFLEFSCLICARSEPDIAAVLLLIEKIILFPALLYLALTLRRLRKSGTALANGDLSYHTDTKGMIGELKQHGEDMNRIAEGMSIAVEERLKSERMKTELITNVSHDIKTPLTSIINYASLISAEPSENEKITEYSAVLVRQSEKLKRLIEDLVEVSKASTGNLEVLLAPCDAGTFLTQASGEYEEKLQKAELTLVTRQPDKELHIMADGRRMLRIFDNLINNIYKYAQPGTRVYMSLEEQDGHAVFTFKNTSAESLDMTAEELMERFTRGDSSRNTEGNGLGLSIAGSMTELQGGSMQIAIDGDLFKAILSFPLI